MIDLVERLQEAAAAAIADERPSLEYDQHHVTGICIELEIANGGAVIDGRCWVERRVKAGRR